MSIISSSIRKAKLRYQRCKFSFFVSFVFRRLCCAKISTFSHVFFFFFVPSFAGLSVHRYNKRLLADVTLVGVDEDAQLFHFELNIVDAEWSVDGGLDAFRRPSDRRLPIEQEVLNAAYLRAHRRAFYFTQACNGEIVKVFHPSDEPPSVVATKKMFVNQLSHRAHGNASRRKRAATPTLLPPSHVESERDNHGVRDTTYSYERKRRVGGDAALDELHVRKEFDTVRTFRPPPELRQTGDVLNTWRARTAEQQLTTLRDGVVHRIERRSQLDFPPSAASYRASTGHTAVSNSKRNVDAAQSAEEAQLNERLGKVKGTSFWLRARATSQLNHKGSRKRSATPAFERQHLGANFAQHLSKRHATEFKSDTPHNLDVRHHPSERTSHSFEMNGFCGFCTHRMYSLNNCQALDRLPIRWICCWQTRRPSKRRFSSICCFITIRCVRVIEIRFRAMFDR
jgi:hypothetical protein